MSPRTRTRTDWVLRGALACTLIGTAHAEYTLAVATGVHPWVAACVPGALDLYVIRALQVRRDVFLAVLVMCAVNVASHLVTAGVLAVDWALISAVGALAPLVLWRVHSLWHTRTRKELLWDVPAGTRDLIEAGQDAPAPDPQDTPPIPTEYTDEHTPELAYPAVPDYVPDPWFEEHDPALTVSTPAALEPAPMLAPEYTPSAPVTDVLQDGDAEYAGALKAYLDTCRDEKRTPSVRGCKEFCKVGQERAKRLLEWAGALS